MKTARINNDIRKFVDVFVKVLKFGYPYICGSDEEYLHILNMIDNQYGVGTTDRLCTKWKNFLAKKFDACNGNEKKEDKYFKWEDELTFDRFCKNIDDVSDLNLFSELGLSNTEQLEIVINYNTNNTEELYVKSIQSVVRSFYNASIKHIEDHDKVTVSYNFSRYGISIILYADPNFNKSTYNYIYSTYYKKLHDNILDICKRYSTECSDEIQTLAPDFKYWTENTPTTDEEDDYMDRVYEEADRIYKEKLSVYEEELKTNPKAKMPKRPNPQIQIRTVEGSVYGRDIFIHRESFKTKNTQNAMMNTKYDYRYDPIIDRFFSYIDEYACSN